MSTVATPQPATNPPKKMYYVEFTADLFDKKPRRFSSYVLAANRWRAMDGLKARIKGNVRRIRIKKCENGENLNTMQVLEV